MIDKEFVLVSQGIEIYRTKSQENAVNMVKEYNDEYFDYLQKCYDNYERPADNYVDLEIEYSNEKEKDKEIESQKRIIDKMIDNEEEYCLEINRLNNIIKEVREDLDKQIEFCTNEANGTTNDKYCRIAINYLKHLKDKLDKGE